MDKYSCSFDLAYEKRRNDFGNRCNWNCHNNGLAGIVLTAVASLLVQSASATSHAMTETVQEASKTTSTNTTNSSNNINNSSAVLGTLFSSGEDHITTFNPINKTYTKISYAGNRIIMPPGSNATGSINATERGNLTFNRQPNGVSLVKRKSLLVTKGDNGSEQENATALIVDLNGVRPNDPRTSTGVAFFSTNSTGKLAFLHNMIAIYQVKASPGGTAIRMWEWKGADLTFANNGNQTTIK